LDALLMERSLASQPIIIKRWIKNHPIYCL
jgi:hypothetical protein